MPAPPDPLRRMTARVCSRTLAAVLASAALVPVLMAQRVNVAKYQTVTASSTNSTYRPDFAVDGIVGNFHSFRSSGAFWLEVSYPAPIAIASAHVYLGLLEGSTTQVLSNFRFQYHDGAGWLDIPGSVVTGNTLAERSVIFSQAVTATRFRLLSNDASGSRTVRELAFFPPNIVGNVEQGQPLGTDVNLNLAYKRPATASSHQIVNTNGAGYPKNAFDGYIDNRSRWLIQPTNISGTNVYLSGEFLEVDLLATNLIGSAHVYSGIMNTNRTNSSPIPDFELQYLSGTNWLVIPGTSVAGNTNSSLVVPFATNVATSRVRLVTTSATPARLQELLLFPPRTGGYPVGQEVINAAPSTNTWERLSDSFYRIRNAGPDLRIGLVSGAVVNVPADANNPQRTEWQLLLNYRDGTYRVRNAESGLCLALARDLNGQISASNNTPVVAEQYTGLPHQDWRMLYANATNFSLANAYSGLVIQPSGSSWSSGTPLVVSTANTSNVTQLWNTSFRRHYPKKGIAGTLNPNPFNTNITYHRDFFDRLGGGSWSYVWGRPFNSNFPYLDHEHVYNPMQWGNFSWTHGSAQGPMENLHRELQSNPKPVYFMGFNEPDKTEQGFMTVEDAVMRWPRFEARDVPLVSPVPADTFSEWNTNFFSQAEDNGYRVDHTAVHWYAGPSASSLITNVLWKAYTNYGNRPIWLTEFSVVPWGVTNTNTSWTEKDNFDFLAEFMWRAEGISWIKRYSLFCFTTGGSTNNPNYTYAPRSDTFNADGSLTPFGQLYAGWDGVTNVVTNRAYHLHAFGSYRRGRNPGGTSAPTAVSPSNNVAGAQWTLFPATTTTNTNTFRIISTLDGRPLRTTNGTNVSLGTNGETGAAVEWRLAADQNGLQFIQHPASGNRRLHLASNSSTLTMVASNNTTDFSEWRFVRPAVSETAATPTSPTGVTASGGVASVVVSWAPVDDADSYAIERLDPVQLTWSNVVTGLTQTAWTNNRLPGNTTNSYRVTAANILGTSPASAVVVATTMHPMSSLAAWNSEYLASLPPQDQANTADPDRDRILNILEYAHASSPTQPGANPFQIGPPVAQSVTIQFPWNWRATDITWRVRGGTNLAGMSAWPVVTPTSVQTNRSGDVDVIRMTFPCGVIPCRFFVLEVLPAP